MFKKILLSTLLFATPAFAENTISVTVDGVKMIYSVAGQYTWMSQGGDSTFLKSPYIYMKEEGAWMKVDMQAMMRMLKSMGRTSGMPFANFDSLNAADGISKLSSIPLIISQALQWPEIHKDDGKSLSSEIAQKMLAIYSKPKKATCPQGIKAPCYQIDMSYPGKDAAFISELILSTGDAEIDTTIFYNSHKRPITLTTGGNIMLSIRYDADSLPKLPVAKLMNLGG